MRLVTRMSVASIALLAVVAVWALTASPRTADADTHTDGDERIGTVTTDLEPGWNLTGWTHGAADIEDIFEISQIEAVYAWDADTQSFRSAVRIGDEILGDLPQLTPGMGLWLSIAGDAPVTWVRPLVRSASVTQLHPGWNLVVWAGEDRALARDVLADFDDILDAAADGEGRALRRLTTGEPFWLDLSAGGRELDHLYEPPEFEFSGNVSREKQDEVRAHVDDVVAFYFERLGFRASGVTVRYGEVGCQGFNRPVSVATKGGCLAEFANGYAQAIQDHLTEGAVQPPPWFREGHADFWAALYADARGQQDYVRLMHQVVLPRAHQSYDFARGQDSLFLGIFCCSNHLRVHVLVKQQGPEALTDVLRKAAELGDWDAAFEDVYGMTSAQFNRVFDQEVRLVPPEQSHACPLDWYRPQQSSPDASDEACATVQGVVTDLARNPRSGVGVRLVRGAFNHYDAFSTDDALTDDALLRGTGADGAFSLTVPEGSYILAFLPENLRPDFLSTSRHYYSSQRDAIQKGVITDSQSDADPLADWLNPVPTTGQLVIAYGAIAGDIFTEDDERARGLFVSLIDIDGDNRPTSDFAPGAFQFFVGRDTYVLEVGCPARKLGWYGGEEGFVELRSDATPIVLEDVDITDLSITLPAGVRCR